MATVSAWLVSFRLRTLPLSLSAIILGSLLAAYKKSFHWDIFFLAVLTTLFLQILSNLANDYGDTVTGVDNKERVGPQRSLQSGVISLQQMKTAIITFIILSLISGISLIIVALKGLGLTYSLAFFGLGVAAIIAALKYTMGKNPYGYAGLGDVFVFLFFGLTGVMGSYYLHTHVLTYMELLPAIAIGCFSTGVLNLNNLRDSVNDAAFGKQTVVVRLGEKNAKVYHSVLLVAGMISAVVYTYFAEASGLKWIYIVSFAGIINNMMAVLKSKSPELLDPELKKLAISTLLFSVLFGMGLVL
jgi:1,4-dihydroxy-2-naphthoate octaprenyltransferase